MTIILPSLKVSVHSGRRVRIGVVGVKDAFSVVVDINKKRIKPQAVFFIFFNYPNLHGPHALRVLTTDQLILNIYLIFYGRTARRDVYVGKLTTILFISLRDDGRLLL